MDVGDGFGICGHKNWYSSSVRCGNWVEDTIGAEVGKHKKRVALSSTTEARAQFTAPSTRVTTKNSQESPNQGGGKTYARDLPKSILMNHRGDGQIHLPYHDEKAKQTVYGSIFGRTTSDDPSSVTRQRQLRMLGLSETNPYVSTTRAGQEGPFRVQAKVHAGKPDARHVPDMSFSKSFVGQFQGGWKLR
jgi:hypothetical protein